MGKRFKISLFLLFLVLWHVNSGIAQDTATGDICADLRFLMQEETTPLQLMRGGGTLTSGQQQTGTISRGDVGDYWSFVVSDARTNIGVIITPNNPNYPLEFAVFRGMERLGGEEYYQEVQSGREIAFQAGQPGIYTLAVRLARLTDAAEVDNLNYQVSVRFTGDAAVSANLPEIRRLDTSAKLTPGSDYRLEDGQLVLDFPGNEAVLRANPGSVGDINLRNNNSAYQVFFGNRSFLMDGWAQILDFSGGDFSVVGEVDGQPRIYYLESFGYESAFSDAVQSSLQFITDSNNTVVRTDWTGIRGVWVMSDCAGFKLHDGRTFLVTLNPVLKREFIARSSDNLSSFRCAAFYIRASGLDAARNPATQEICLDINAIEVPVETRYFYGLLETIVQANRQLTLQANNLTLQRLTLPTTALEGFPVEMQLGADPATAVQIRLDWIHLSAFAYASNTITFTFTDPQRSSAPTTRDGLGLRRLEAVDDVIEIIYSGDNPRQHLMLPASESYLEIITPEGTPQFTGAPYDGRSLPDEPGYAPGALNNMGGECYPINTLLPEANCPPAGHLNPSNGNLWYAVIDHQAFGADLNLTLTRSYNSYDYALDGSFGYGWFHEYPVDYNIAFDATQQSRPITPPSAAPRYRTGLDLALVPRGFITYTTASGSRHVFLKQPANAEYAGEIYRARSMPGWVLTRSGTAAAQIVRSAWELHQDNGLVYNFDRAGRLKSYGYPRSSRFITIDYPWDSQYNGPGELSEKPVIITDEAGMRQLELYYDANHHIIRSILRDLTNNSDDAASCDAAQNCFEILYEYENGYLTGVVYPDGQRATYLYNDTGQLIYHDDVRAPIARTMQYTYQSQERGIAQALILPPGTPSNAQAETSLLWQQLSSAAASGSERIVEMTDEYGTVREFTYLTETGALADAGSTFILLSVTDPLAQTGGFADIPYGYGWDTKTGFLLSYLFRRGGQEIGRNTTAFEYNAAGLLTRISGGYPSFQASYQEVQKFPVSIFAPATLTFGDGSQARYTADAQGRITNYVDRYGANYAVTWNENGQISRITCANDGTYYDYAYDRAGLVRQVTLFSAIPNDPGYTTAYLHDGLGRIVQVEDSLMGKYTITYGLPTSDDIGRVVTEIQIGLPDGGMWVYRFDERNRLIEKLLLPRPDTNYLERTTYDYEPLRERLIAENRWLLPADGDSNNAIERALTTAYTYTPLAALTIDGQETYIGGYQVIRATPGGLTETYIYDAHGRIRRYIDSDQQRQDFTYSVDDVTNPAPNDNRNVNGLRITQHDFIEGRLTVTTRYLFDLRWQLTGVARSLVAADGTPVWQPAWRFLPEQDTVNLRIMESTTVGINNINWEDSFVQGLPTNAVIRRVDPDGINVNPEIAAGYDFLGRPLTLTQSDENVTLAYCPQMAGGQKVLRSGANSTINCDGSGVRSLSYDAHGRLVEVSTPEFVRRYTYTLDATNGGTQVVAEFVDTASQSISTWELMYDAAGRMTTWRDDTGFLHLYTWDTLGRLRRVITRDPNIDSPLGYPEASFTYTYNDHDLLLSSIDGLGRGFQYTYNDRGQVILRQSAETKDATSYTYNPAGLLASSISPQGAVTSYVYADPADPRRLTEIITASGRHEFEWNDANRTIRYTDTRGKETTYYFDSVGLLWAIDSPLGWQHKLRYDKNGHLTEFNTITPEQDRTLTLAYSPATSTLTIENANESQLSWRFVLTAEGQVSALTTPDGSILQLNYDGLQRLRELNAGDERQWLLTRTNQTAEVAYTDGFETTTLRFDALYRLIAQITGDVTTQYEYRPQQTRPDYPLVNLRVSNADTFRYYSFFAGDSLEPPQVLLRVPGQTVTYAYNAEGVLEAFHSEICLSNPPYSDLATAFENYNIDIARPPTCSSDPNIVWRRSTRIQYDTAGRPVRVVGADQNVETFAYDNAGNLVAYQTVDGETYTYVYDDLNRLERLVSPGGTELLFAYQQGKVAGICQTLVELRQSYNACVDEGGLLETYTYNSAGQLLERSYFTPDGETAEIAYDYSGGLLTEYGSNSAATRFSYSEDGLAQVTQMGDYSLVYQSLRQLAAVTGSQALEFEYDAHGRLVQMTVAGRTLIYEYASDNRSFSVRDAASNAELRFVLGENGLLQTVDYPAGSASPDSPVLTFTEFGQTPEGDLAFSIEWNDGYFVSLVVNRQNETLLLHYIHEDLDLFTLGGRYVRNADGLPRRIVYSDGEFVLQAEGYIITYGYDSNNNPLTMRITEEENGSLLYQVSYVYTDFGQLASEDRQYANGLQISVQYRYSRRGNPPQQRTITINQPNDASNALPVEAAAGVVGAGLLPMIIFKRRRKLVAVIFLALLPGLAALAQISTTRTMTFTHSYDNRGRLENINVEGDQTCVRYTYDNFDRLVQVNRATDNLTTNYEYDVAHRLTQAGNRTFIYAGDDTLPFAALQDGQLSLYAHTREGRQFFQATGNEIKPIAEPAQNAVLGSWQYSVLEKDSSPVWIFDPFGRYLELSQPSFDVETPCNWLRANVPDTFPVIFEGMIYDAAADVYFTRGRAYAPQFAHFLQRDPLGADVTGNLYGYPANRPTLPLRSWSPPYPRGLEVLAEALKSIHFTDSLHAANIQQGLMPQPSGDTQADLYDAWRMPVQQQRDFAAAMLSLPVWLVENYNLPAPYLNSTEGHLLLPPANAPGQGGRKVERESLYAAALWDDLAWLPTSPTTTGNLEKTIQSAGGGFAVYTTYQPINEQLRWLALPQIWRSIVPEYSPHNLPSAVLTRLPQPYSVNFDPATSLPLLQILEQLTPQIGQSFIEAHLENALPSLPELPAADVVAWRDTWFDTAPPITAEMLGAIWQPFELPTAPSYSAGANDDWLLGN